MKRTALGATSLFIVSALGLAACGGGSGSSSGGDGDPVTPPTPTVSDVTSGLVANYLCNGNAEDAVGTAHGTASGGLTYVADRNGNAGQACGFDGADGKVTVASAIAPSGSTGFSVSFWTKTALPAFAGSVIAGKGSTWFSFNSLLNFTIVSGSTNSVSSSLPSDAWTHVVGTYDNATDSMSLYVGGVLVQQKTKGSQVGGLSLTSLEFGQSNWPDAAYWTGALDDMRLYDRALSADEVQQLYDYQN